jgi:phosphoadenosine phosphosulfate reductase
LKEWRRYLQNEKTESRLPEQWLEHGFHRFKKLPPHMKELAGALGIEKTIENTCRRSTNENLIDLVEGYGSCIDGLSREGVLSDTVDFDRLKIMASILGVVKDIDDTGGFEVRPDDWKMTRALLEAYPDGTIVLRGENADSIKEIGRKVISVLKRSMGCIGCMICAGRCCNNAISLNREGRIVIDPELCIHCGACLGPCPAESFGTDPYSD